MLRTIWNIIQITCVLYVAQIAMILYSDSFNLALYAIEAGWWITPIFGTVIALCPVAWRAVRSA